MPPATATRPQPETTTTQTHVDTLIVGTGFSGLGMAIKLKEAGNHDFVIIEKADSVAGTWRENTYPGCACDVPSHMYSFSFEPNPSWSEMYSPQPEIRAYLERVADKYELLPHIRFNTKAVSAEWDETAGLWRCVGEGPEGREELTARFVVSGIGGLHIPAKPQLQGIEGFEGPAFHSAEWDHSVDLRGKRVAVIGTGASAIQFVPEIATDVAQLDLYQRTAPWVLPKPDRHISRLERSVYKRFPLLQRLYRNGIYWFLEGVILAGVNSKRFGRLFEKAGTKNLEAYVKDPVKREKLTPSYEFGCKRLLMSNTYYRALGRDNADVVTDPIAQIGANSITTADGTTREADVIIYGTGFDFGAMTKSVELTGEGGTGLDEFWSTQGLQAYNGSLVAGFPNLFFLLGPNTGLGHNSVVFMIECQVRQAMQAMDAARAKGERVSVGVTAEAHRKFDESLQGQLKDAVWARSCKSWYLDARGRNIALWPGASWRFWRATRRLDLADLEFKKPTTAAPASREMEEVAA